MHEISFNSDGGAEIVTGGGVPPWHGLGEIVADNMTVWAALERARLDWTVERSGSTARIRHLHHRELAVLQRFRGRHQRQ